MAEEAGNPGGATQVGSSAPAGGTPTGTPTTPATPSIPAGHRLVSDADYARYEGAGKIASKLEGFGIKSADDLGRYDGFFGAVRDRRIDPSLLAGQLTPQAPAGQPGQGEAAAPVTPESVRSMVAREHALVAHSTAVQNQPQLIDSLVTDLVGPKASEHERELYRYALTGALEAERAKNPDAFQYPKNHVLAGDCYSPFTKDNTKTIFESFKGLRGKLTGSVLAQIGDAAASAGANPPAGERPGTPSTRDANARKDPRRQATDSVHERIELGIAGAFAART